MAEDEGAGKLPEKEDSEAIDPEIMDDMPEVFRKSLEMTMISGRMPHPLMSKLTPEHVTKIIDSSEKEDVRRYKFSREGRWLAYGAFVILILLFIFLVIYLSGINEELLMEIIKAAIFVIAGFSGGYGYCKSRS